MASKTAKNYIALGNLDAYKTAIKIGEKAWIIYVKMDWQTKKIMGDQWLGAIDSVGANIAEGYGRFHYLDKIKFYYNSRGSLFEAKHWSFLLLQRAKITKKEFDELIGLLESQHRQLNNFIKATYPKK